jgi:uncharacterized protein YjdB
MGSAAVTGNGWSSSDPAVATVSGSGLVTTLQPGMTTIMASYAGLTAQSMVTVR